MNFLVIYWSHGEAYRLLRGSAAEKDKRLAFENFDMENENTSERKANDDMCFAAYAGWLVNYIGILTGPVSA